MKRKFILALSVMALLTVGIVSGVSAQETFDNIVDVLAKDNRFDTAYDAVIAAGLADTLASADATYTVFVPRDAAFTALDNANPAALGFLLGDPEGALTDVLLYHVIPGKVMASDLVDGETLTTLQGGELTVDVRTNGDVFINGARVVTADIPAKNGVIHVINQVLVPAGLELPEAPEVTDSSSALPTIAEVLTDDGRFTSLLSALEATSLTDTFTSAGDYTVFAPTDEAFAKLGDIALTESDLRAILLYHVVGDSLTRDQLATDDLVPTLFNGRPIIVNRDGPMILNLSGAKVVTYNVPASNGIIHVIDQVMIP
ncbi:MAG: fasciclin domain-containing protein [Anaerolineales bacterium]|uniref:fasciclin domain-containing protein n=1 Tax=Promineifilum sp. TaxID=2664178 RepID=UPI001DF1F43A|nr:fasciclin domain-containing protein [Anaerolineales bacterium]MCO5179471.1 fasciclin domain-containing protein [Promineifilum sp.]